MFHVAITWSSFATMLMLGAVFYYVGYGIYFFRKRQHTAEIPEPPPEPDTPVVQEWMEEILLELEKEVRRMDRLHYHPDEIILSLQKKIESIKSKWI